MPRKRNFIVFALKLFAYVLLGLAASNSILYVLTKQSLGSSYYNALVVLTAAKHTAINLTLTVSAAVFVLVLVLVVISSVLLTHKISGPMHRFEKIMDSLAKGDFTVSTKLRANDYLTEQAEDLGKAIGVWDGKLSEIDSCAKRLKEGIGTRSVKDMREANARIKEILSFFKMG